MKNLKTIYFVYDADGGVWNEIKYWIDKISYPKEAQIAPLLFFQYARHNGREIPTNFQFARLSLCNHQSIYYNSKQLLKFRFRRILHIKYYENYQRL